MINEYRNAIRDLIERLKRQGDIRNVNLWQVQDDEVHDPTLLSLRAFGSRGYADEVLIACGVSGIWEALPKQKILLPKPDRKSTRLNSSHSAKSRMPSSA